MTDEQKRKEFNIRKAKEAQQLIDAFDIDIEVPNIENCSNEELEQFREDLIKALLGKVKDMTIEEAESLIEMITGFVSNEKLLQTTHDLN